MADRDAVEQAIATIEDHRRVHVEWADWQDATPGWEREVRREPRSVGTPEHHRRCVAVYDQVLDVLRSHQALQP